MNDDPVSVSDADPLAEYQRTDGESGNPEVDSILVEIARRGLDI